jgi:tetratricopeptide (TPR) repeat protein
MVRAWLGAPKRLLWSFVLLLLLPAAAVAWLGVQLLEQDREIEARRIAERRERAADRAIAEIEKAVAATERQLSGAANTVPILPGDDAVVVTMAAGGVEAAPRQHLLYQPQLPVGPPEPSNAFDAAQGLEFAGDLEGAATAYRALAGSPAEDVRAGALLRLARTLRKTGRKGDALNAYEELERLARMSIEGLPADLVARRAKAALLAELGRSERVLVARALDADLQASRWILDRGTFEAYSAQVCGRLVVARAREGFSGTGRPPVVVGARAGGHADMAIVGRSADRARCGSAFPTACLARRARAEA